MIKAMKIKEVIVVEGKNDSKKLKSFFDVETIETGGSHLSQETLTLIQKVNEERGVILLLDPDHPGEYLRKRINEAIPNLKNAFVFKKEARTSKKVGIEHASFDVLEDALKHLVSYEKEGNSLTMNDLFELGLSGSSQSNVKREAISYHYHIGKCNSKTFLKRLNMLDVTKKELQELLNKV